MSILHSINVSVLSQLNELQPFLTLYPNSSRCTNYYCTTSTYYYDIDIGRIENLRENQGNFMLEVFWAASTLQKKKGEKIVIESAKLVFGPERLYAESKIVTFEPLSWMNKDEVKNWLNRKSKKYLI